MNNQLGIKAAALIEKAQGGPINNCLSLNCLSRIERVPNRFSYEDQQRQHDSNREEGG
jgi:hypothetical protein